MKKFGFLENTSIYMLTSIFTFAVSILILPVYTRFLSPIDFGIVVLFMMFGNLLCGFLGVNLHFASYRYYFKYKDNIEKFKILNFTNLFFVLFSFFLFGIVIYHFSDRLSSSLFSKKLSKELIQLSFLSGCLEYIFLYLTSLLSAQLKVIPFSIISISRITINTILSLYFIFQYSLTYMARINAIIITQVFIVIILVILTRKMFLVKFSFNSLKKSLKLSYPILPHQLIGVIQGSFDKTMLNKYVGPAVVGYYSIGERFSTVLKAIMDSISKVWEPYFMDLAHKNTEDSKRKIISRFYELAFIFILVGMLLIYFSEELVIIFTTQEFYPAMFVIPIYVYFYIFSIIGILAMNQISFSEKMIYIVPGSLVSVVINIILNILFIPKYGAVGAAAATAIAAFFQQIILLYFGMKLFPLPLRKIKLFLLYLMVFFMTILVYPIMISEINSIIKIILKLVIISLFFVFGVKANYIKFSSIHAFINRLKIT